jgi:4'-phosphopantetheinyl transferase
MKFSAPDFSDDADVHVWHIDLVKHAACDFVDMFANDEIKRRNNFVFDRDRDRFTRARVAMRFILGAYLGIPGRDVKIVVGPHGKPCLDASGCAKSLQFNMTHSENLALFAVSGASSIGVDVEMMRMPGDIRGMAKSVFSIAENTHFETLSDDALIPAFFSCWTQKEAVLKALGTGLSIDAKLVHVGLDATNKKIAAPPACGPQTISVTTLLQTEISIASLAVVGDLGRVLHFDYSDTVFDTIGTTT